MARRPSPAQIAHRLTWQLQGYLKRIQLMYILAAVQLAKIRDEGHWKALRHPSIEDYAQKRLGLSRTTLYHYLQIHDWLKREHRAWLAPKPKGFIPSLTGASALMWIEKKLRGHGLSESARKDLAAMRAQAMRGTLTDDEFRALRARLRGEVEPLRALLARLKSITREAGRVAGFPADAGVALGEAIRAVERALASNRETAKLLGPREILLAGARDGVRGRLIRHARKSGTRTRARKPACGADFRARALRRIDAAVSGQRTAPYGHSAALI